MKKISIVTGTRAEYGLLRPLIRKINNDDSFEMYLAVTGMHLSNEFGLTYREIENDGFPIDVKFDILLSSDTKEAEAKAIAFAINDFTSYFEKLKPNMVIVLGDRFEIFSASTAAAICHIPIAHIHGGETTEGAEDEFFRHSITKMSYLHFTSCEEYRKRVIQLGESPERVFNVGALGVENILQMELMTKEELEKSINFDLDKPYIMVTFHPVTLENNTAQNQVEELLKALDNYREMFNIIFTKANADFGGRIINDMIDKYCDYHCNTIAFKSMGVVRYLSAVRECAMVIGNSSSGIIEAPSFGIPTINIGDRQKGRLQATSVINCEPKASEIINSINLALSDEFKKKAQNTVNPYGNGETSDKIISYIKDFIDCNKINLKKKFYDVDFEVK